VATRWDAAPKQGGLTNGVAVVDLNANLQDAYVSMGSRISSRLRSQGRPAVQRVLSLGIEAGSEGSAKAGPGERPSSASSTKRMRRVVF
jgi:hypothetical protein